MTRPRTSRKTERRKTEKKPAKVERQISVGDHVLLGGTYASYPGHWSLGQVLWVGRDELLVERRTLTGEPWLQLALRLDVRAVGTVQDLITIHRRAAEEVRELVRHVDACESALGIARQDVHDRLAELQKNGLDIIPADFRAIAQLNEKIRCRAGSQDVADCHG